MLKTLGDAITQNLPTIVLAILAWLAIVGRKALYNWYLDWFPVDFKIRGRASQQNAPQGLELKVTLWINKRIPDTEIIERVDAKVGRHQLTLASNPPWQLPPKGTFVEDVSFAGLNLGNYSGQIMTISMSSRNRQGSKAISRTCIID